MMKLTTLALAFLAAAALSAMAQPQFTNAQVSNQAVTGTLDATVRSLAGQSVASAWIGWETAAVPRRGGDRGDNWCWSDGSVIQANRLEPADTIFVFLRVENKRIERVRMFDQGCPIDAGHRPVTWLTGVPPAESIALLAALAGDTAGAERSVWKGALAALAQHAGPAALQPLLRLARQAPESRLRGDALFWLAQRAGREASLAITDAIEIDPETDVKKRAVFALSQLPADEGVPKLIEVARNHRNPAVRKQAMFWLGQSKDARALAFFEEVLK